jgi:glycerol-3-phosphate O-acyltransferase
MPAEISRGAGASAERPGSSSPPAQEAWPFVRGRRLAFLLDAASSIERHLLERWIDANRPDGVSPSSCELIAIPSSRRRGSAAVVDRRLDASLAADDDPLLAPLRIAWLPPEKHGSREVRFSDLVTLGDPRDPGLVRQEWLRRDPDRYRVVVAEPAPASVLRGRWRQAGGESTLSLTEFVVRQAHLALERAERRLRGSRYKVPRFVHEEILARPAFRGALAMLARERGVPEATVTEEAARVLREIAATHSPYVIDLAANLIRLLYTRGYGERLHYDRAQLRDVYSLTQRYPVVFLPSHKSNLDHLVLQYALHENGHPPNHTAGGINMNFFPVGPLIRRSGLFFIRRSFKDDPVYKLVLRQYIDYLIEKRFSLEWYIEGGRSRSGKLLPPRLGLLAYVIDSFRRGRAEDVYLIPTAIAYDQIQDVGDYVAESRGAAKQRENLGWLLKVVRGIQKRLGNIYIRFGEPLSLAGVLDRAESTGDSEAHEESLAVAKIAFEVAVRINRVTPITPTSLVTLAMLGADRAVTVGETVTVLRNWVDYVVRRGLPTTEDLKLNTADGVRAVLDALATSGVVTVFSKGPEPVYAIGENQHLAAAYYRNTIVHFFVNSSIAELSLLHAAEDRVGDRVAGFWDEVLRLRDLLKFEFFFAEKERFRDEIRKEVKLNDLQWEARLADGPEATHELLRRFRPLTAHRALRPFVEAYRIVGDELERLDPGARFEERAFFARCLARGEQYRLQRLTHSAESVSSVLFATALKLAANRGLLDPGGGPVVEGRAAFAAELRQVIRRIEVVAELAARRRARLNDQSE